MIPKANKSVKYLILSVLEIEVFEKVNKSRKDFIVSVLWHILSIKGRINFLQLGRFSTLCEQTYRNQFAKKIDFFSFNTQLINQPISDERVIAFDPCYIVKAVKSSDLEFISRLRNDSVLKYKFTGERTGKKGAPKKFAGLVDVYNFNPNHFSLDLSTEEITIYSLVVYSRAFKMDIKLAIAIFYKQGVEMARKLYFSTDLKQDGEKIVRYYRSRFQIEFLYRDAKQFTGLTSCQARSKNKLDFHFNAALTAVNLAKHDWLTTKGKEDKPFSMSDYKTMYNNNMMLERFMCMFAINPNTPKIKKLSKNYWFTAKLQLKIYRSIENIIGMI